MNDSVRREPIHSSVAPQPVIAQQVEPVQETRNYRPFIIFGNLAVAFAVVVILGIVSLFIGILATAFM